MSATATAAAAARADLPSALPYELRIGVTGHRTLADPAGTARAVRSVLDHLARTFEAASAEPRGLCGAAQAGWRRAVVLLARALNVFGARLPVTPRRVAPALRTPLRWTVVSPLARGADRIVAEAVLDRPEARLEVLLPFPQREYERDFETDPDLAEFRRLVARAAVVNTVGSAPEAVTDEDRHAEREAAYYKVGQAVVDGSEILVAIWDGQPASGHGGTAEIVRYAVQHDRLVLWVDATSPSHPVQVLRRLEGTPGGAGVLSLRTPARPGPEGAQNILVVPDALPRQARHLSPNFHQLAAYNRDVAFDPAKYEVIYHRNLRRLDREPPLPARTWQEALRLVLPHYARADQLALRYQWLYTRAASGLFYLSATAVTLAVVQALFFPGIRWLIVAEVAAMVLVVLLLGLSREGAWHEKWLQDRHLAEQLRIAFFSRLADIHRPAGHARAVTTLPCYRGPDSWVFAVVDGVVDRCPRLSPPDDWHALREYLSAKWIADQHTYHQRNAALRHRVAHRARLAGLALFGGTLVAATLHMLDIPHHLIPRGAYAARFLDAFLVSCAIALPAWGAASHAANALLERERIAARSLQMARVLGEVDTRMHETQHCQEFLDEVERAREVMVAETHEWLVSLSFRGPVLPA